MNFNLDYLTSMSIGLFMASIVLILGRLTGYPITGTILAVTLAAFITSLLYNPGQHRRPKHSAIKGTSASLILSLIFGVFMTLYYIPRFSRVLSSDMSTGVSILVILAICLIGGIIIGTISGNIGSTFRDVYSLIPRKK